MTLVAAATIDPYRRTSGPAPASGEAEFSFEDALDVVNPLQHIPLVGWLYREITGDAIKTSSAIAGGALYGGPIGFAGAILHAAFESLSGETPEDVVARILSPSDRVKGHAAYRQASGLADG